MGMTIIEKIFAKKSKVKEIKAGMHLFIPVDLCLVTDISAPLTIEIFRKLNAEKVFDPDKIVLINDHLVPAKDIASANMLKIMRDFAKEQNISKYYEMGRCGICHITVPEEGLVAAGDIIIGTDSHTCTYGAIGSFATGVGSTDMAASWATGELWFRVPESIKVNLIGELNENVSGKDLILYLLGILGPDGALYKVLEFGGSAIKKLSMADRFTMSNMSIECGAKAGIFPFDSITEEYLKNKKIDANDVFLPDLDANYFSVIDIDLSQVNPKVAVPFEPSNVHDAKDVLGVQIDQVVIGSCTNGRIEDFRIAHKFLKGKVIAKSTRLIIIPGSPKVLKQMISENMLMDFIDAGCTIAPSACGPCIGMNLGILGENEVGLYTTNRNFVGRNGAQSAKVYLCSPAVAAVSAIEGRIVTP